MTGKSRVDIGAFRRAAWWLLKRSRVLRQFRRALKRRLLDRHRRVPVRLGVSGLIAELERRECRYVVLRWFDDLPEVDEEGDIDILIDDEHAEVLGSMLTRSPRRGRVSCDVFSVHGSPGFDHHRFPYYPPAVAEGILSRAIRHSSGALVPSPEDHFLSLAFHALYHKGYGSGLPVDGEDPPEVREGARHDYRAVLEKLAAKINLSVPITMRGLDRELEQRGWKPPPDMLMKWAVRNDWCRHLVESAFDDLPVFDGLAVGLVREVAADDGSLTEVVSEFHNWGFEVLVARQLESDESERAARLIRGGNWGRGTWPRSGGRPAAMIVAVDPSPSVPSPELEARHPGVDNGRVFSLKQHLRDRWNDRQPAGQRANILHSSDNASHALHYLHSIAPTDLDEIIRTIERHTGPMAGRSD